MTNFEFTPDRRRNSLSIKWSYYPKDRLPLWVADMDFRSPEPILKAMRKQIDHGVIGYEFAGKPLQEVVAAHMKRRYNWTIKPESIINVTGIVGGYSVAVRAFATRKKGVAIQPPVYNEFHEIKNNIGVPQIDIPMIKRAHGNIIEYEIDWEIFEKRVKKAAIFLLCNPHNPLGIIHKRKDLLRMAEICIRNNVLIISDEIHSELMLDGNKFTPLSTLSREIADHTITFIAPSKTFNIPGLFCGFAIIPNDDLRKRYQTEVDHLRMHVASPGLYASQAAYSGKCDPWLKDLLKHLTSNRDFLYDYITQYMPGVRTTMPQATYLGWLDFTKTGMKEAPYDFFFNKAKVALSNGTIFGQGGEGHVRINFGTSRAILNQALDKMRKAMVKEGLLS
jgi:cystathionine beta-lyase